MSTNDDRSLKPLLVYVRQSRAKLGETRDSSLSLEQQRESIETWAPRNGYRVEQIVNDHDETGRSLTRPGIQELKERARPGLTIAVWKYDRFARNLIGQELVVEELRSLGVDVVSTTEPPGKLPRQLMGSIAEYYSDQLSERIIAIREASARRGDYTGGPPPYGYRRQNLETVTGKDGKPRYRRTGPIEPNPDEAPVVREIYRRYLAGESLYEIGTSLQARGVPRCGASLKDRGVLATDWHPSNLTDIIRRPFYMGKVTYKGAIVADGKHEPLIDAASWQLAQERRILRASLRQKTTNDFASWAEGYITHACGARMHLTPIKGKRRRDGVRISYPNFVCNRSTGLKRCGIPSIVMSQPKLEQRVREAIKRDIAGAFGLAEATARASALAGGDDAEQRRRSIDDRRRILERRYAKARELYLENEDEIGAWRAEKARHAEKIAELDAELAALPTAPDPDRYAAASELLAEVVDLIDDAPDKAMGQILEALGRIVVTPAGVTMVYRAPFSDFIVSPVVVGS